MSQSTAVAQHTGPSKQQIVRGQLNKMDAEIEALLPEHVSLKKFKRVILTAVGRNPELLNADRDSLFASCLDCATDGLILDGKKAALVVFKTKDKKTGEFIAKVQYMPMVSGIYDMLRNAGEIKTIAAHVVHAKEYDEFRYWVDDDGDHIRHTPMLRGDRGEPVLAFAVCRLLNGAVEVEAMPVDEIERVRQVSKMSGRGPWQEWWGEMAKKTVIRRLSKRLPMSADQERIMQRDDILTDLDYEEDEELAPPSRPKRVDYEPKPPALGEDLDAAHRRATKGTIPDDEPPDDKEAEPETKTKPAGPFVIGGFVILYGNDGKEIGRYQSPDIYFQSVKAALGREKDPRAFLVNNEPGANYFVSANEKWMEVWTECWVAANEAEVAEGSMA